MSKSYNMERNKLISELYNTLRKSNKSLTFSAINNDGKEVKLRASDLDAAQEEAANLNCLILYMYVDGKKFGCCLSYGRAFLNNKILFNYMTKVDPDPLFNKLEKSGKKITFGYWGRVHHHEIIVKEPSLEWIKHIARSSNCNWINVYVDKKKFGVIINFEDMKISLNTDEIYKLLEKSGKNLAFSALNNDRKKIKLYSPSLVAAQEEAMAQDLRDLYVYADDILVGECIWLTDKLCYSAFKRVYWIENSAVYKDLEAIVLAEVMTEPFAKPSCYRN